MSPKALGRNGQPVAVTDLVAPICLDCKTPGTPETLHVQRFVTTIPPASRAYWVCAAPCTGRR